MKNIVIKDLDMSKELDQQAMKHLVGGRRAGASRQSGAWKPSSASKIFHTAKPKRMI